MAHGAGLMLVPVLIRCHSAGGGPAALPGGLISASLAAPLAAIGAPGIFATAVGVHTVSLLLVTGIVAAVVYEKLGVALLRRAWVNLDLVWSVALLGAGVATLML